MSKSRIQQIYFYRFAYFETTKAKYCCWKTPVNMYWIRDTDITTITDNQWKTTNHTCIYLGSVLRYKITAFIKIVEGSAKPTQTADNDGKGVCKDVVWTNCS